MTRAGHTPQEIQFEAVIVPHRSLSAAGLRILLGVVLAACVISSTVFTLAGAWPIGLFAGLELLLAAVLFRLHIRAARASELLMLTHDGLSIIRHLAADWMTVRLDERPGRVPALMLLGHNQSEEVGRVLGEDAKRALAQALAAALHRRRNPRFDNPQLR